jgi:hypothetical protein
MIVPFLHFYYAWLSFHLYGSCSLLIVCIYLNMGLGPGVNLKYVYGTAVSIDPTDQPYTGARQVAEFDGDVFVRQTEAI